MCFVICFSSSDPAVCKAGLAHLLSRVQACLPLSAAHSACLATSPAPLSVLRGVPHPHPALVPLPVSSSSLRCFYFRFRPFLSVDGLLSTAFCFLTISFLSCCFIKFNEFRAKYLDTSCSSQHFFFFCIFHLPFFLSFLCWCFCVDIV